jgi:hypothetical protein
MKGRRGEKERRGRGKKIFLPFSLFSPSPLLFLGGSHEA